jgi:hypothetical protein
MKYPGANLQVDGDLVVELDRQPAALRPYFDVLTVDRKFQRSSVHYDIVLNGLGRRTLRGGSAGQMPNVIGKFAVPQVNREGLDRDESDCDQKGHFNDVPEMAPA